MSSLIAVIGGHYLIDIRELIFMGINNKHTVKERQVARRLIELRNRQQKAYKRWHEYDLKISVLEGNLKKLKEGNDYGRT